jgi:hypothetical protein
MINNRIRNNLEKMYNQKRDYTRDYATRRTVGVKDRRDGGNAGIPNHGRQMMRLSSDDEYFVVGSGGPPVVT